MSGHGSDPALSTIGLVDAYYRAYTAPDASAVSAALGDVLDENVILDSPIIQAKFGQALQGKQAVIGAAMAVAPLLKNATVEGRYVSAGDAAGAAALIHFPSPAGVIFQSEHFDIDASTMKITRIRSYYDPRKLLAPKPQ